MYEIIHILHIYTQNFDTSSERTCDSYAILPPSGRDFLFDWGRTESLLSNLSFCDPRYRSPLVLTELDKTRVQHGLQMNKVTYKK